MTEIKNTEVIVEENETTTVPEKKENIVKKVWNWTKENALVIGLGVITAGAAFVAGTHVAGKTSDDGDVEYFDLDAEAEGSNEECAE